MSQFLVGCNGSSVNSKHLKTNQQEYQAQTDLEWNSVVMIPYVWKEEFQSPAEAQKWIEAFNIPNKGGDIFGAPQYIALVKKWKDLGLTPKEANTWRDAGYSNIEVKKLLAAGKRTPAEAYEVTKDELEEYFSTMELPSPLSSESNITFARIGDNLTYAEALPKICAIPSFKTINGVIKEKFCSKNSVESKVSSDSKDFFDQKSWRNQSLRKGIKYKVKDKNIICVTSPQQKVINGEPLVLKGVEFKVLFIFKLVSNENVIKGALLDESTPFSYYSIKREDGTYSRYTYLYLLKKIILTPISVEEYSTQLSEILALFKKKYPYLKKDTFDKTVYQASSGETHLTIYTVLDWGRPKIVYKFDNETFMNKYYKIYKDDLKKKLDNKKDDSNSI